jgi:hypothetical protein
MPASSTLKSLKVKAAAATAARKPGAQIASKRIFSMHPKKLVPPSKYYTNRPNYCWWSYHPTPVCQVPPTAGCGYCACAKCPAGYTTAGGSSIATSVCVPITAPGNVRSVLLQIVQTSSIASCDASTALQCSNGDRVDFLAFAAVSCASPVLSTRGWDSTNTTDAAAVWLLLCHRCCRCKGKPPQVSVHWLACAHGCRRSSIACTSAQLAGRPRVAGILLNHQAFPC